jgi:hypothetical protein
MMNSASDQQGIYRQGGGAWSWYWQNGTLVVGTVPWANVGGKPTTLSGYGITDAAPINSPALTGTPTAPTPAGSDNLTKLATTAFVQTAVAGGGGGMVSTISLSPAGSTFTKAVETSGKPGSIPYTSTTTASTTNVTLLSISGKGVLRFLGTGHSTATGGVDLTVIVDGATVLNGITYSGATGGIAQAPLAVAVIGSISLTWNGTNYLYIPVPEDGFAFATSLVIQAKVTTGTAYVGWTYRLYA